MNSQFEFMRLKCAENSAIAYIAAPAAWPKIHVLQVSLGQLLSTNTAAKANKQYEQL